MVDEVILAYAGCEPLSQHFYLHHSGTRQRDSVSVCSLSKAPTYQIPSNASEMSTLGGSPEYWTHRYRDFIGVPPHGYAVVASSTVIVSFLFLSVDSLCTVWQFLTVFSVIWATVKMILKVLCVVFSNRWRCITVKLPRGPMGMLSFRRYLWSLNIQRFLLCSWILEKGTFCFFKNWVKSGSRWLLLLY